MRCQAVEDDFVDTFSAPSVSSCRLCAYASSPSPPVGVRVSESLEQEIRTLQSLLWSERDPDGRAFAPLADAYRRAGETKEAFDVLTDGMSRHPEFTSGHVVAARLYLEQGMHSEAEFAARRVLDLDGENVSALASLPSWLFWCESAVSIGAAPPRSDLPTRSSARGGRR